MNEEVFTQGIEAGGLRDSAQVKILVCYLLSSLKAPISKNQLNEVFTGRGLVNYFELSKALSELTESKHITIVDRINGDDYYKNTSQGLQISSTLEKTLPTSVREKSYKAAVELLSRQRREAENKVEITQTSGGYTVKCTVLDERTPLMSIELFVGDKHQAKMIKKNFFKNPEQVYKDTVTLLTSEDKTKQ